VSAGNSAANLKNLPNWLLHGIETKNAEILYSATKGTTKSIGFRALAHLCIIPYPRITTPKSPILSGQWTEQTRDYAVFRFLLTGVDESALTSEDEVAVAPETPPERSTISPDTLAEMIRDYEAELAKLTDNADGIDAEETAIEEELAKLESSIRNVEGQISRTSRQRKTVYESYNRFGARINEITELLERFKLLDAQYSNDIKRLVAIEESGQFFVLREPMACPLCGAQPEGQHHDAACDGNVAAVTQAAKAEIAKIWVLQSELHGTVTALAKEKAEGTKEQRGLAVLWRQYQSEIDSAMSPDFASARERHASLIERRAHLRQADVIHKRIRSLRRRLDEPTIPVPKPVRVKESEETPEVVEYIPKPVLREFSQTVSAILTEWHFPDSTDVYFDEVNKDVVIGGRLRGSRGAGLCAITYSAFTLALFEFCRSRSMPHPGLVILDSPLIAYKEPKADDEGIAGTDLKRRFYEHLDGFAGEEQIFIVDNTEPPAAYIPMAAHFTANPDIPRSGLFPSVKGKRTESLRTPVRLPQVTARTSRPLTWKERFVNRRSAGAVSAVRTQRKRRNRHGKYGEKRKWRGWIAKRK
jgi:archaellum component FlaC